MILDYGNLGNFSLSGFEMVLTRYVSTYIITYYLPSGTFLLTLSRTIFPQVRFFLHFMYYLSSGTFLLTLSRTTFSQVRFYLHYYVLPSLRYVSTYIINNYLLSGTLVLTLSRTNFPQVRFFLHYHVLPSLRYVSIYIITY